MKRLVNNIMINLGRFDHHLPQPWRQITNTDDELDILMYFEANPKSSVKGGEKEIAISKSKIRVGTEKI